MFDYVAAQGRSKSVMAWVPQKLIFLPNVQGNPQINLHDQGVIDSGCLRHMTGSMSYLTDYKEIDEGYVAFGGNPKGRKIAGKDHLGKFDSKADEGFFVGYSLNSKAFRVFNRKTRILEEKLHIKFIESTPDVVGTQSNGFADAMSSHDDGSKPLSDDEKKVNEDPRKENEVKIASIPMESQKPLLKDEDGEEVDVHMYRSMIGSLMYLTSLRPDIMFAVCAYARYQVNLKVSHLYTMKRIFRFQETMGDTTAQIRFESVSKHSNDSLLARGDTLQSDEDSLKLNKLMGRRIDIFDEDKDITLVSVQDNADNEMFDVDMLGGKDMFVAEQNDNIVEEIVYAAQVSTTATTTTITNEEITLAQALKALKTSKPKAKGIVFKEPYKDITLVSVQDDADNEMFDVDMLGELTLAEALEALKTLKVKAKGIVFQEPELVKPKKKDQIRLGEEAALNLQAEFD
nr:putative ribonuclease H-like domain-containing protein [Tanacetum cinerariifolium]